MLQPFNIRELLKRLPRRFAIRLIWIVLASMGISVPLLEEHPLEGLAWRLLEPAKPASKELPPAEPAVEWPIGEADKNERLSDSVWRPRRRQEPNPRSLSPKKEREYKPSKNERPKSERIGCICMDGSFSSATGRGACSGHGGVARWIYEGDDPVGPESPPTEELPAADAREQASEAPSYWLRDFSLMEFSILIVVAVLLIALMKKALEG